MQPANPQSCKTLPMPAQVATLAYRAEFTEQEFYRLARGVVPRGMENNWFIFLEEDVLHCHRSWTGYCIYQVALERYHDGYRVTRAVVNRDPTQYQQSNDDYDLRVLDYVIGCLLLGFEQSPPVS